MGFKVYLRKINNVKHLTIRQNKTKFNFYLIQFYETNLMRMTTET